MFHRSKWLTLAAAVAVAALFSGGAPPLDSLAQAQSKAAKKPSKKKAATHVFKVQARHPKWRVIPAASKPAAHAVARALKRQGWKAQVKARAGRAFVRAKMTRWHTRGVVTNRPSANRLARVLRAQHFQSRVIQVK